MSELVEKIIEKASKAREFISKVGNFLKERVPWKKVGIWGAFLGAGVGTEEWFRRRNESASKTKEGPVLSNVVDAQISTESKRIEVPVRRLMNMGSIRGLTDDPTAYDLEKFGVGMIKGFYDLLENTRQNSQGDDRYTIMHAESMMIAATCAYFGLKPSSDFTGIHVRKYLNSIENDVLHQNGRSEIFTSIIKKAIDDLLLDVDDAASDVA